MARNQFEDPAGNRSDYSWDINHFEEEEAGPERTVQTGANTSDTGLVRQQTDDTPLVLSYSGTILKESQVEEMIAWYVLCKTQTIFFHDFAGDSYEVLIRSFKPRRVWTLRNPRDPTNASGHYWTYSITMDVIRVIDGPLAALSA